MLIRFLHLPIEEGRLWQPLSSLLIASMRFTLAFLFFLRLVSLVHPFLPNDYALQRPPLLEARRFPRQLAFPLLLELHYVALLQACADSSRTFGLMIENRFPSEPNHHGMGWHRPRENARIFRKRKVKCWLGGIPPSNAPCAALFMIA